MAAISVQLKRIARKSRNSWSMRGGGCEYIGTFDSVIKCYRSLNQIQTLKDCLSHHIYCAHLGTLWHRAVTAFCAVSYTNLVTPSWVPREDAKLYRHVQRLHGVGAAIQQGIFTAQTCCVNSSQRQGLAAPLLCH